MVLSVTAAKCNSIEKREDKTMVYLLEVHWKNKTKTNLTRTFFDLFDFTNNLKLTTEGMKGVTIPPLPGLKWFQREKKRKGKVDDFCKGVLKLAKEFPTEEIETEVMKFFNAWLIDLNPRPKQLDKKKDKKNIAKKGDIKTEPNSNGLDLKNSGDPQLRELQDVLKTQGGETSTEPDPNNQFIVSSDYLEPEQGQVVLHTGDIVEVMERTMTGWWYVFCDNQQKEGWAPASILEPLDPYAKNDVQPGAVATSGGLFSALTDYTATKDDELSYNQGQVLEVISMSLDGWWTAKRDGKIGLVSAPNITQVVDVSRDTADVIPLYETFSVFQQHSIYKKKPPPRRNPDLCLEELYAQVDTSQKIVRGPKPEPLSPKPQLLNRDSDELYAPPEVPVKSIDMRYTEITFDDETPGKPRSVIIGGDGEVLYSEIVLDDKKPAAPVKQQRTKAQCPPVAQPPKMTPVTTVNFYEAVDDYTPNSTQAKYLALKKGTIVVVQKDVGELLFCELCKKETAKQDSRSTEGFVPRSVLRPTKCDILREENGVKIVRPVQPIPTQAPVRANKLTPLLMPTPEPPVPPVKPPTAVKTPSGAGTPHTLCTDNPGLNSPVPTAGAMAFGGSYKKYKWFAGVMDRATCSEHMADAAEGQFLVRESKGEYSLSVASQGKIRHFQIKHSDTGQYVIGGYNFADIKTIVKHYKKQHLYYIDHPDNKHGRCLGEPFLKIGGKRDNWDSVL